MPLFVRENNKVKEVKDLKRLNKNHIASAFAEETVRERAAALDNEELMWAVDELTKRGRIRGTVII